MASPLPRNSNTKRRQKQPGWDSGSRLQVQHIGRKTKPRVGMGGVWGLTVPAVLAPTAGAGQRPVASPPEREDGTGSPMSRRTVISQANREGQG